MDESLIENSNPENGRCYRSVVGRLLFAILCSVSWMASMTASLSCSRDILSMGVNLGGVHSPNRCNTRFLMSSSSSCDHSECETLTVYQGNESARVQSQAACDFPLDTFTHVHGVNVFLHCQSESKHYWPNVNGFGQETGRHPEDVNSRDVLGWGKVVFVCRTRPS